MKMPKICLIALLSLLPFTIMAATIDVVTGPTSGSTLILITADIGETFGPDATVTLGGRLSTLEAVATSVITIKSPEGIGQNLDVVVTSSTGTIICSNQFSYESPILTSISPEDFFTRGGEVATLNGSNFGTMALGLAEVSIGGNPAIVLTQSHEKIEFRIPTGSGANQNVRVRVGGQLGNNLQVDYLPPSIWKIEPTEVTGGSGDTLYITGINFGNGFKVPEVRLGNVPCIETVYAGDDHLYCITGIGSPADLDVQVLLDGQLSNSFTLRNKKPTITFLSKTLWSPTGGEEITLLGQNLGRNASNIILELDGRNIPINSLVANSISFFTIPGSGQNLPLRLMVNGVESEATLISYEASTLTSITPTTGSTLGSVPITINGLGIGAGNTLPNVLFGDNAASDVQKISDNQITCNLPAGVGQVDVKLELNGIASNTLPFSYNSPQIVSLNPFVLPLSGGEVAIAGLDLGNEIGDAVVVADGLEIAPKTVNFGVIVADLPAGFGQGKDIFVKTGGSNSNTLPYSYTAPNITGITPEIGLPGGVLRIIGNALGGNGIPSEVKVGGVPAGILSISGDEIRCVLPAGSGSDLEVEVSQGSNSDVFTGFSYANPPSEQGKKVEVVGQLRITELPFKESNGTLLGVDQNGNLFRNTDPQISVSITNDTLFIGANQFLIIPGISKSNAGN